MPVRLDPAAACGVCLHFQNDPSAIEKALPGLSALGSAHASGRDADGYCGRHGRYLRATARCGSFRALPS